MGIREDVFYEGGPHRGDLIISILLAFTIIFIPLTVAAIVRALWLRYRITSRRISITGGWRGRDRSDVIYSEVSKIATVPRGIGTWGDIVVTLKDGSRLEMRAIPRFREIYDYIAERTADKTGKAVSAIKMM
ncbi:ribonuclease P [Moorena producens PAL-8-15-08-1]|uniref:Ribonuclease P n=1 Tax=Moorena producens PAL-8-15-08-1 TaxID=1458985 RepID=A0A1D8TW08_9CYAN|nr:MULTISPECIES: PH domain-containing protein [Moorena]AOX01656.1 ribonuclease P [Moorena producens PAL-8-15-08-1]NEO50552.1 PH domain-containing protein [Moorena sp. SIO4A3]NEO76250.1 PH domain-containing protein [Moorena sp. SIO4G3]